MDLWIKAENNSQDVEESTTTQAIETKCGR